MTFKNYTYFYFDLDKNIFDTFDKYKNPIWARQMIPPFNKIDDYIIEDDCLIKRLIWESKPKDKVNAGASIIFEEI